MFRGELTFAGCSSPVSVFGCGCGSPRGQFLLPFAQGKASTGKFSFAAFSQTCDSLGPPCRHVLAVSLCRFPDSGSLEDIPTVAQLEGPHIRVSVGLPDTEFLSRAVCERTEKGWRCLDPSCDRKSKCMHTRFLEEEASLQADLAELRGSIFSKPKSERKVWTPAPIGLRKINVDVLGNDWDSTGAVYDRAAKGMSSLSATQHAIPPTTCACAPPTAASGSGSSESKTATKCTCGVVCPACGSAWRDKAEPDCEVWVVVLS